MRIRSERFEGWLAPLAVWCLKGLFLLVRRKLVLSDPVTSPYVRPQSETFTYCVWHDSLIIPLFLGRQPATMALVGGHRDGGFVANCLRWLGIPCARGSASKGGVQAVRQLIEESAGQHLVLTPDGPRGPRRTMKAGCAFLSAHTGKAVVPTACACTNAWYVGSGWTDLMIPKPFSKLYVVCAPPIVVPTAANKEQLAQFTQRIQSEMDRVQQAADELAGVQRPSTMEQTATPRRRAA
ncbi:MAG: DUF374 domain-containing protein [Planctomycetaceae bacterium]|nr:DUF374 domain-containing protein [Planctomycetaceae bacterium]